MDQLKNDEKNYLSGFPIITDHPHKKECEEFESAMEWGYIQIVNNEILIQSRLPKTAKVGNVLTNEKYNPDDFVMGSVIRFCPWCSKRLKI